MYPPPLRHSLQSRLDEECARLVVDIRRIGVEGEPRTTFGELFDDDDVSNYYEALVGTLKAAKKRKMITFQGQLLLKGVSDKVEISIVEWKLSVCDAMRCDAQHPN